MCKACNFEGMVLVDYMKTGNNNNDNDIVKTLTTSLNTQYIT